MRRMGRKPSSSSRRGRLLLLSWSEEEKDAAHPRRSLLLLSFRGREISRTAAGAPDFQAARQAPNS